MTRDGRSKRTGRPPSAYGIHLGIALFLLAGCVSKGPPSGPGEQVPPIPPDTWREVREEVWMASTRARDEAEEQARQAMHEWFTRVREKSENKFVPWYSSYWTQQWIGFKAGWYEMNGVEDQASVEDRLAAYLRERYYELVLEPAGRESDPRTISRKYAAEYVRLLSAQMAYLPDHHAISRPSLTKMMQRIPLIAGNETLSMSIPLSTLLMRSDLTGMPAYEALFDDQGSPDDGEKVSLENGQLKGVAEDTVARLVAELPVRAGSGTAALIVGEAVGLFISAGVTAWSAMSHERDKPEIESQLRAALDAGLEKMWRLLMEDPERGVLSPVNTMNRQLETALFPISEPEPAMPF